MAAWTAGLMLALCCAAPAPVTAAPVVSGDGGPAWLREAVAQIFTPSPGPGGVAEDDAEEAEPAEAGEAGEAAEDEPDPAAEAAPTPEEPGPEDEPAQAEQDAGEVELIEKPGDPATVRALDPSPEWTLGGGIGIVNIPIEQDLTGSGVPVDFYVQGRFPRVFYDKFRVSMRAGLNRAEATLGSGTVTTTSLYLAGHKPFRLYGPLLTYALFGMAQMMTTLEGISGVSSTEDSGIGFMVGAGALYPVGPVRLGGQYVVFRRDGSLGGIDFVTGSNQIQIVLDWPLK